MRAFTGGFTLLIFLAMAPFCERAWSQREFPPRPLPLLEDDCTKFSSAELESLLSRLKAEREGLDAEWKTLAKKRTEPRSTIDEDQQQLQQYLKRALRLIEQDRLTPKPIVQPEHIGPKLIPEPEPKKDVPTDKSSISSPLNAKALGRIEPLYLAQVLYRAEKYDEALKAFRLIDLKGKKAEERVPIQFMIASCLLRCGKSEEATELLREAANSRGDERFAGYAQWQLEMIRWQHDVNDRLQNIRKRRLSSEKSP